METIPPKRVKKESAIKHAADKLSDLRSAEAAEQKARKAVEARESELALTQAALDEAMVPISKRQNVKQGVATDAAAAAAEATAAADVQREIEAAHQEKVDTAQAKLDSLVKKTQVQPQTLSTASAPVESAKYPRRLSWLAFLMLALALVWCRRLRLSPSGCWRRWSARRRW